MGTATGSSTAAIFRTLNPPTIYQGTRHSHVSHTKLPYAVAGIFLAGGMHLRCSGSSVLSHEGLEGKEQQLIAVPSDVQVTAEVAPQVALRCGTDNVSAREAHIVRVEKVTHQRASANI